MLFDEISNCPEDLGLSRKGIRDVPRDKAALEAFRKLANKSCFHLHDYIHLAYRHVLEALGPMAVQRDPLFVEYIAGLGRNPSKWVRASAPGLNPVPAEMVGQRLRHLAAAGVAETNEKNSDGFTLWAMGGLSHWGRSRKSEIGNSKLN